MNASTSTAAGLRAAIACAAVSTLLAVGGPPAVAAPTASPPFDVAGYVDSTARCTRPDTAVIFGATETSRIAICSTANGAYEYRGVRVSDGAKLIVPAKQTGTDTFVVANDGATYTVTPTALSVTIGGNTVRTETWTDFHQAPGSSKSGTSAAKPSTSSAKPSTSSPGAASTAGAPATAAAPNSATPSSVVPLPPPLPAEVGGGPTSLR
ncbi:MAG: hypothetical protein KDB71_03295 [Mycobacterium sp.]|nr:hypothetical protein [Mycobacterium sp.]